MSVTINAKGTSVPTFTVGKNGLQLDQAGEITPPPQNDLRINLGVDKYAIFDSGNTGPALITSSENQDLHINPAVGGGQFLILNNTRWPVVDGTLNQVLTTNGNGILSWTTVSGTGTDLAPDYQEFSAIAAQTIFNTTMPTLAKGAGKAYLQVFVNGVFQQEGATKQFTVTGPNQITFALALDAGDDVVIFGYT